MAKEKILLIGGGGHSKSCIEVIESTNLYDIVGIIDQPSKKGEICCGYQIVGCDDDLPNFYPEIKHVHITVGQIKTNVLRYKLFQLAKKIGFTLPPIVASTAYVSKYAKLAEGCIVMHNVFINAGTSVGVNSIINTNALLEHDVQVGDQSHISTSAILNGDVKVGKNGFIGSNTCINNGVIIGNDVVIGSHTLVRKNIDKAGVYFSNNTLNKM